MSSNKKLDNFFAVIRSSSWSFFKRRKVAIELENYITDLEERKDNAYKERDL